MPYSHAVDDYVAAQLGAQCSVGSNLGHAARRGSSPVARVVGGGAGLGYSRRERRARGLRVLDASSFLRTLLGVWRSVAAWALVLPRRFGRGYIG